MFTGVLSDLLIYSDNCSLRLLHGRRSPRYERIRTKEGILSTNDNVESLAIVRIDDLGGLHFEQEIRVVRELGLGRS